MSAISANKEQAITGKAGMPAFTETFMPRPGSPKAVVESNDNYSKYLYITCPVGNVRAGITSNEATAFADSFKGVVNEVALGVRPWCLSVPRKTPAAVSSPERERSVTGSFVRISKLCMTVRKASSRADQWAAV
jgi:hypothetical protein